MKIMENDASSVTNIFGCHCSPTNCNMAVPFLKILQLLPFHLRDFQKKKAKGINKHKNYLKLPVFSMEQKVPANKPALFQLWQTATEHVHKYQPIQ